MLLSAGCIARGVWLALVYGLDVCQDTPHHFFSFLLKKLGSIVYMMVYISYDLDRSMFWMMALCLYI